MDDSYIELNAFLKCKAIVPTGGQAKTLIRSEAVLVNDVIETRNKKKLHTGDKVTYDNKEYIVDSDVLRL